MPSLNLRTGEQRVQDLVRATMAGGISGEQYSDLFFGYPRSDVADHAATLGPALERNATAYPERTEALSAAAYEIGRREGAAASSQYGPGQGEEFIRDALHARNDSLRRSVVAANPLEKAAFDSFAAGVVDGAGEAYSARWMDESKIPWDDMMTEVRKYNAQLRSGQASASLAQQLEKRILSLKEGLPNEQALWEPDNFDRSQLRFIGQVHGSLGKLEEVARRHGARLLAKRVLDKMKGEGLPFQDAIAEARAGAGHMIRVTRNAAEAAQFGRVVHASLGAQAVNQMQAGLMVVPEITQPLPLLTDAPVVGAPAAAPAAAVAAQGAGVAVGGALGGVAPSAIGMP